MAKIVPPSRMMLTPVRIDAAIKPGESCFDLWRPPDIDMGRYTLYTITEADQGRLDRVAWRVLGDERLWWAIAHVNDIAEPLGAIEPGTVLRIPTVEAINAALLQQEPEAASA